MDTPAPQSARPAATPTALATPAPAPPVQAVVVPAPAAPPSAGAGPSVALSSGESDYVLVIGDVIELNVFREPELTTQATIARDGTVQLP